MNNDIIEYEEIYKNRCRFLRENGVALEELNNYNNFEDLFSKNIWNEIIRRKQNRKNKRYRVKQKYKEILCLKDFLDNNDERQSNIVFGTITLKDKYLKDRKEETRIKLIEKWLKQHFIYSILNKDYGEKKGREHYHFIGLTQEEEEPKLNKKGKQKKSKKGFLLYELKNKNFKLGFEPTICIVDYSKADINKTIDYLLKLNNHSTKNTTKDRVRIIKKDILKFVVFYKRKK